MTQFRSLNLQIKAATFDALSNLERAVSADRTLTVKERIVLEQQLDERREYLGKAARA